MSTEPSITFWSIFRSILRPEHATEDQVKTARTACAWIADNLSQVSASLITDEARVLGLVYDHWRIHKEAPSYAILRHVVDSSKNAVNQALLDDYERISSDLTRYAPEDLQALVRMKYAEHREDKLMRSLREAALIITEGLEVPAARYGKKEHRKGTDDAMKHIREAMDRIPAYYGETRALTHCVLGDPASRERLKEILTAPASPNIPTGVACLDQFVHARRGQFIGVLGYAGSGKTRLCRTWAHHAATVQGLRVLHISLEQSHDEELKAYAVIHAHAIAPEEAARYNITFSATQAGRVNHPQAVALLDHAIADLAATKCLVTRQATDHTWAGILGYIQQATDAIGPLDMVIIDYLTAVEHDPRNAQQAMGAIIAAAKRLAQTYHEGRGLLVVTPVQANRGGKNEAKAADGHYDISSVSLYSSIDKFADAIVSVYGDKDLAAQHRLKLSTAKNRFGPVMSPHEVTVHTPTQTLVDTRSTVTEAALSDLLADL